jgi:hypothetical protein
MQVDVVEARSTVLFERMERAQDFGTAESAHAEFLAAVLDQALLASPKVAQALKALYALCTRLCSLVQVRQPTQLGYIMSGLRLVE